MSDLPFEITEKILVRVSAKSLVRFNSVCKHWRSLISDPKFVKEHLSHALLDQSNNHHRLIVNSRTSPFLYSIDYESLNSTRLNFPLPSPNGIRILCSCNGLLFIGFCTKYSYDTLLLWNPLLRGEYNHLPQCSSLSRYARLLGFGYDSSIDDYKVVRLGTNSSYCKRIRCIGLNAEIYSLKTNSWKTIVRGLPYHNAYIRDRIDMGTLVNGSIYWLLKDSQYEDGEVILAFDLIDEKFRLVETPRDDDDIVLEWWHNLMNVRGCLGLYQTNYSTCEIFIWILNENENKNKYWTKVTRIPKELKVNTWPIFFMKNDQVLLCVKSSNDPCNHEKKLVVYGSENMEFQNLPTCVTSVWSEETIYVESLVLPNGERSSKKN